MTNTCLNLFTTLPYFFLSGYPFALFQRYFLFQKETYLIHLYNVFTGLSIAYFNFGKMSLGRAAWPRACCDLRGPIHVISTFYLFLFPAHRDAVFPFPAMCPNPVPDTETNGSHNHWRHHHISLSDGKTSFLFPGFIEGRPLFSLALQ